MNDITKNVVVSSRVRLARNYKGLPFPQHLNDINSVNMLIKCADKASDFKHKIIFMDDMSDIDRKALMERHLISPDLAKKTLGALILSNDQSIAVMVNEEDHIRAQCIKDDYALEECYNIINHYDDKLSNVMPIAYDSEFGYLTACLTNVGTGMRASVMLFLPAITFTHNIDKYIGAIQDMGLTMRGVYGEGSDNIGAMYQLSNAFSMGMSERDIISNVERGVEKLCAVEQGMRQQILNSGKDVFLDKVYRAYGVLCNARILSSNEFMTHIAYLKFGMAMNIIDFNEVNKLDELIIRAQPANLIKFANIENLSADERDVARAHLVRQTMQNLK